jgi:filamentous hemagglutinin
MGLSSDMFTQGKYGVTKGAISNALNNAKASGSSSGQTLSAIRAGTVIITDEQAQLERTGQTAAEMLASLNREAGHAHTAAQRLDVEPMRQTVEAQRAIKQAFVREAVKFTDESYRVAFLEKARVYKVARDPATGEVQMVDGKPVMIELTDAEKLALEPQPDGKLNVFTNGIFNDKEAAARYAVQMSELPRGEDVYLVYYPQANNALSELMVAGYQYFLEGRLGDLSNATQEIQRLMEQHGTQGLNLVGHSRGAMTIGNALESLAGQDGSAGLLSHTEIKLVGPAYSAQRAATLLEGLSNGNRSVVSLQNHADDFVGVLIGNNPATYNKRPADSSRLKEWWRIFGDAPTVHSCYGTMAVAPEGCHENYGRPKTIDVRAEPRNPIGAKP